MGLLSTDLWLSTLFGRNAMSTVDEMNDVEIIEGVNSDGEEILKEINSSPKEKMSETADNIPSGTEMPEETKVPEKVSEVTELEKAEVGTEDKIAEEVKTPA